MRIAFLYYITKYYDDVTNTMIYNTNIYKWQEKVKKKPITSPIMSTSTVRRSRRRALRVRCAEGEKTIVLFITIQFYSIYIKIEVFLIIYNFFLI